MYKIWMMAAILILSGCASNAKNYQKNQDDLEMARHYYDKALYSESERLLLNLEKRMPDNYDIHFRLGNIYVRTGQFPAAEARYRKCIEIDGAEPKGWYNLSLLKVKESIALADEGYGKSKMTDVAFSQEFLLLRERMIQAITGK